MLLIALLVGSVFLPGCLTLTLNTKINPNGSGERSIDVAIDESFAGILEESVKGTGTPSLEKQMTKGLPKDATFRQFRRGKKVHYETAFSFDSIDELNQINQKSAREETGQTPRSNKIALDKKDWLFFVTYKFYENFPASQPETTSQAKQLIQPFTATYKLSLPGRISKANADKTKGNSATWYISPSKGTEVNARSYYVRWWAIIIAVVLLLLIIVGLVIIFLPKLMKKRSAEPTPSPELLSNDPTKTRE